MARLVAVLLVGKGFKTQPHRLARAHKAHSALEGAYNSACSLAPCGTSMAQAEAGDALWPGSASKVLAGFARGARTTRRCSASCSAAWRSSCDRSRSSAPGAAAGQQWQAALFALQFGLLALQRRALAHQALGCGAQRQHLFGLGLHLRSRNKLL